MKENNALQTQEVLRCLPRQELRRLLSEELHKENADDERVRLLLKILNESGGAPTFYDDEAVAAACEKFRQDTQRAQKSRKCWHQIWMLRVASMILVLGILFFMLPGTANASGFQGILSWWSDSIFQFFRPGQTPIEQEYVYETDNPGLQEIYDAVAAGITEPVVPRWVPNGFELTLLDTYDLSSDTSVFAYMNSQGNTISFSFIQHSEITSFQHEKGTENISIWELANNEHYVISNYEETIVTWVTDRIECTAISDCPEEDVYRMIKSIYTSED